MTPHPNRRISKIGWLVLVALILVSTACSADRPATSEPNAPAVTEAPGDNEVEQGDVTITFTVYEYQNSLYKPLVDAFHEENPTITVQLVPMPEPSPDTPPEEIDYFRMIASAADTAITWSGGFGSLNSAYFRDVGPLIDMDPGFDPDDFWPGMLDACQDPDGRILGVPLNASISGVFYDEEAFDQAGLPYPEPGWTWEDFRQAVIALAEQRGDQIRYGFADQPYLFGSILTPLVDQYFQEAGDEVDPAALEEELQWYIDLAKQEAIYPIQNQDELGNVWEEREKMFREETRPVMWTGNIAEALPGSQMIYNPDEPFSGMAIKEEGFAPYPVGTDAAESRTSPVYAQCGSMSAGTKHPREAWAWLSFLTRQRLVMDENQPWELLQAPARQSVADSSGFWENIPEKIVPSVRYVMEHAWFGTLYPEAIQAANVALAETMEGSSDFASAFDKAMSQFPETPQSTKAPVEIVVATPKPPPPPGAAVIDYFYDGYGPQASMFQELVETYNQAHPDIVIEISRDFVSPPEDQDWLSYLAEKYDCFTWYGGVALPEKPAGLLSLDAFIQAEDPEFLRDFAPEQLDLYRLEGELLGLPGSSQPRVMAYNIDLLEKRGLEPPSLDWTFDDFIELATAASSTDPADRSYGLVYGEWEHLLLAGRGVKWADMEQDPPVAHFDSPEMISAMEWVADLVDSGVLLVQKEDNWQTVDEAMRNGQVAFWLTQAGEPGFWAFQPDGSSAFKIGMAPMPVLQDNEELVNWSSNRGSFISENAEEPQACWDWIKFLSEQPNAFPGVPARLSILESPAYIAEVGEETAAAYRQAMANVVPPDTDAIGSRTGWPFYTWYSQAVAAALKGEDSEAVLSEAQLKAEDYLDCITLVDISDLSDQELQREIGACAQQADPEGNWPR